MNCIRLSSNRIVNLEQICQTDWIGSTLCVKYVGRETHEGFTGDDSHELWQALKARSRVIPKAGDFKSVEISGINMDY